MMDGSNRWMRKLCDTVMRDMMHFPSDLKFEQAVLSIFNCKIVETKKEIERRT
jgi:hypothetical protein